MYLGINALIELNTVSMRFLYILKKKSSLPLFFLRLFILRRGGLP